MKRYEANSFAFLSEVNLETEFGVREQFISKDAN